ncbi:MAG TPA: YdeI/OmpD-associated family protein [Longimicrobiaceae bacterium]
MTGLPDNSIHPADRAGWRAWLEENHARPEGVWMVSYRRATGRPRVEYDEAVEEALCFGWIDGKAGRLDDERSMQWFAPRKAGSGWARSNKERVARLAAEGRMAPAGLARVEAARRDGSWSALDAVEALEVPPDLEAALAAHPDARRHWDAFPKSARRAVLAWIGSAKKPETRARRVEETARLAQENVRANQPRKEP